MITRKGSVHYWIMQYFLSRLDGTRFNVGEHRQEESLKFWVESKSGKWIAEVSLVRRLQEMRKRGEINWRVLSPSVREITHCASIVRTMSEPKPDYLPIGQSPEVTTMPSQEEIAAENEINGEKE